MLYKAKCIFHFSKDIPFKNSYISEKYWHLWVLFTILEKKKHIYQLKWTWEFRLIRGWWLYICFTVVWILLVSPLTAAQSECRLHHCSDGSSVFCYQYEAVTFWQCRKELSCRSIIQTCLIFSTMCTQLAVPCMFTGKQAELLNVTSREHFKRQTSSLTVFL